MWVILDRLDNGDQSSELRTRRALAEPAAILLPETAHQYGFGRATVA